MNTAIELDYFGGYAPIQAWGKVDDLNFYFRARWDTWTFEIGKSGADIPASENDVLLFTREGEFLANDFHEEMAAVIINCFREFFLETQNSHAAQPISHLTDKLQSMINFE